jgi:hypothetical protein
MNSLIVQAHKSLTASQRSLIYPGATSLLLGATLGPTNPLSITLGILVLPWTALYIFFKQSSQERSWKKTVCGIFLLILAFPTCTIALPVGGLITGRPLEEGKIATGSKKENEQAQPPQTKAASSDTPSENLGDTKKDSTGETSQAKPPQTPKDSQNNNSNSKSSDGKIAESSLIQSCAIGKVANDDGISAKYLIEQMLEGRGEPKYLANIIMEQMKPICPKVY